MGGKSKSKSNSKATQQATQNTMNGLNKHKVSNEVVSGMQQDLADTQTGNVGSGLNAMISDAMGMFGQNPMMNLMGSMMGIPMQVQTPDALQSFIDKYRPPTSTDVSLDSSGALAPPQQPPQQPQQGMNNGVQYDQYGRPMMNGRGMY